MSDEGGCEFVRNEKKMKNWLDRGGVIAISDKPSGEIFYMRTAKMIPLESTKNTKGNAVLTQTTTQAIANYAEQVQPTVKEMLEKRDRVIDRVIQHGSDSLSIKSNTMSVKSAPAGPVWANIIAASKLGKKQIQEKGMLKCFQFEKSIQYCITVLVVIIAFSKLNPNKCILTFF